MTQLQTSALTALRHAPNHTPQHRLPGATEPSKVHATISPATTNLTHLAGVARRSRFDPRQIPEPRRFDPSVDTKRSLPSDWCREAVGVRTHAEKRRAWPASLTV